MGNNPELLFKTMKQSNECGYFKLLGMEILEVGGGKSRLRLAVGEQHMNPFGTAHGGVYCSLLDAAVFFACFSTVETDQPSMTSLEMKVNFIAPVRSGEVFAEGSSISTGKSILVGEARVLDSNGRLLAAGTGTCMAFSKSK